MHTHEALEAINFGVQPDYQTHYEARQNEGVKLASCPFFTTSVYDVTQSVSIRQSSLDSFVVLIGLSGEVTVSSDDDTTTLHGYETLLIASENKEVRIVGSGKFLEVHI